MVAGAAEGFVEPRVLQCPYGTENFSILETDNSCNSAAEYPKILSILASLFEKVVIRNDRLIASSLVSPTNGEVACNKLTIFHGLRAPSISIEKYLNRIFKYANCSPGCFVAAYIYIDRLIHRHPDFKITSLNVHRLLITSVLVAAKFLDDAYFNNAYYAKVGGVTISEMNRLELEFLFRIDFKLHLSPSLFGNYCMHLERELAITESQRPRKLIRMETAFPISVSPQDSMDTSTDAYEIQTPPRAESYGRPHQMFQRSSPMVQ